MPREKLSWRKSILTKLALILLLLLIPSFLLYVWAYSSFSKEMRTTMEELALAGDNLIFSKLDSRISNNVVQQYLLYNNSNIAMTPSLWNHYNEAERAQHVKGVQEVLRFFGMFDDLVRETTLYVPSVELAISSTRYYKLTPEKLAQLREWAENQQTIVATANGFSSMSHSRFTADGMPRLVCEVQIADHFFYNLLGQLSVQGGGGILFIDEKQIYSHVEDEAVLQGVLDYYMANRDSDTVNKTLTVAGKRVLYYHMQTSIPNISLILYRPYNQTLRNIQAQALMIPIFLIVSVLIIILLLLYMQGFIRRPVIMLSEAFAKLNSGEQEVRVRSKRKDEFNELFENFNDMSRKLQETIEQVYRQKIEIQRAELKQLQSQIDPHFLYNSFFLLKSRIRRGDDAGAMGLANLLGDYFRFVTRQSRDFVPLSEEYAHAEVYARIQNNRFLDRFHMEFHLPEELGDIMTPRLILQPVVENSIKYCVETSEEPTTLRLSFCLGAEYVLITVEDSGDITDEDIAELNGRLQNPPEEVSALVNIHLRLCIYNNDQSLGLVFRRSDLGGLAVDMKLCVQ